MNEPIFCALAFNSISWSSDGKASPCCGVRNWTPPDVNEDMPLIDRANQNAIVDLRKALSSGIYPEVCKLCEEQDIDSRPSMRTIWNNAYNKTLREIKLDSVVHSDDIVSMNINIGNKCNSKCMTCGFINSDLWLDEYLYIFGQPYGIPKMPKQLMSDNLKADEIVDSFKNLKHITFMGGEPTISDNATYMLKRYVREGRSKDIELTYTTNLTGITDELLDLWSNFKNIGLNVSIDGYGKVNEYIRYPFSWEKIDRNLDECLTQVGNKKMGIGLGITASLFNSNNTHELFEYWYDKTKNIGTSCGVMINKVLEPDYMMLNLLPIKYRMIGVEHLYHTKNKISLDTRFKPMHDAIDTMLSYLQESHVIDKKRIDKIRHFIKMSDKYRKRDIRSFLPELYYELYK